MSKEAPAPTHEDEVRSTIVKSSLTGVAASVLAVTVFSPAGLGGLIGTSVAAGGSNDAADESVYANLPAYPSPLSSEDLLEIRGQLASTTASLEITRAATEARIEHIRAIALSDGEENLAPLSAIAAPPPVSLAIDAHEPARVPLAEQQTVSVTPVTAPVRFLETETTHLELAELLFAQNL